MHGAAMVGGRARAACGTGARQCADVGEAGGLRGRGRGRADMCGSAGATPVRYGRRCRGGVRGRGARSARGWTGRTRSPPTRSRTIRGRTASTWPGSGPAWSRSGSPPMERGLGAAAGAGCRLLQLAGRRGPLMAARRTEELLRAALGVPGPDSVRRQAGRAGRAAGDGGGAGRRDRGAARAGRGAGRVARVAGAGALPARRPRPGVRAGRGCRPPSGAVSELVAGRRGGRASWWRPPGPICIWRPAGGAGRPRHAADDGVGAGARPGATMTSTVPVRQWSRGGTPPGRAGTGCSDAVGCVGAVRSVRRWVRPRVSP